MTALRVALVAVFGALGAVTRYAISSVVGTRGFPLATLGINVVGSFALGAVVAVTGARLSQTAATAVGAGFLGAFTTYSTFSVETTHLIRDGRTSAAAAYVAASVLLGLGAAALGYALART